MTNVSKFFARPKTAAAQIRDGLVDRDEIKHRSAAASEVAKRVSLERNRRWVGWTGDVLVDEKGKIAGYRVGRNCAYKPVAIKSQDNLLGRTVKAEIQAAAATYLKGRVV